MANYVVKRGDTLSKIATNHGIKNWMEIYNHPQNIGIKRRRPNPNQIEMGDVLFIPGKSSSSASGTNQSPQFGPPPMPAGFYPQPPPGYVEPPKNPSSPPTASSEEELITYKQDLHADGFLEYLKLLKPGDILFTTEDHWISNAIKTIAGIPISHCNLYTKPNYLIDSAGRVQERYIPPHFEKNNFARAIAFQNPALTPGQRSIVLETAKKFEALGTGYDNMQLVAHGISTLSSRVLPTALLPDEQRLAVKRFFVQNGVITLDFIDTFDPRKTYSRTFGTREKLMCSSLIVFAYMNAKVNFNMTNPDLIGTDDLYYYCEKKMTKKFDVSFSTTGVVDN